MTLFFRFAFFCLIPLSAVSQNSDIFGLEASKTYAEHLFKSAQYETAALEYERLIILDTANQNSYYYLALVCYRKSQQIEIGLNRLNDWFPDKQKLSYPINKEFSLYLTGKGWYNDAIAFLNTCTDIDAQEKITLLAINHCYLSNWLAAETALNQIEKATIATDVLAIAIEKGKTVKLKKPVLAAALSIIPGLGRVYTGNYVDAGLSLLTIATFGWQAYSGFDKNGVSSAYGWVTGSVTAGFYFGNIYGSYRAAQLFNKQQLEEIVFQIDRAYSLFM